jgi:ubiquinone/menaquinone biosynthesis C-methylase UbiE
LSLERYKQIIEKDFIQDIDFIDEMIKKLNLDKNSKILDIGTGIGAMSILLAINGFSVLTGEPKEDTERDEWFHHHGENHDHHSHDEHFHGEWSDWRESAKKVGVENRIKYQNFNAENLPFDAETFDGIFIYDSLQHIHDRELTLNECIKVLKNDGKLCVIEWSEKSIKEDKEKYGYEIDFIDPKDYLNRDDVLIKKITGEYVNFYIIQKK